MRKFTVKEFAKQIGKKEKTIRQMIYEGRLQQQGYECKKDTGGKNWLIEEKEK